MPYTVYGPGFPVIVRGVNLLTVLREGVEDWLRTISN